jgi:membrane protein required for colicin V production
LDVSSINLTDIAVVLVILFSGLFAFFRGFVHEILAVASWVGAAAATLIGFPFAQPEVRKLIAIPLVADLAAGVAIFLIVLVLLSLLTRMLANRVRGSGLGPLDRSLGLVFGFLRGALLVSIAWLVLSWVLPREDYPGWLLQARTLPLVERGGSLLVGLLPERLRGDLAIPAPEDSGVVPGSLVPGGATQQSLQNLMNPPTKTDAPETEAGYNARMRDEMQRAIEAATQGHTGTTKAPEE